MPWHPRAHPAAPLPAAGYFLFMIILNKFSQILPESDCPPHTVPYFSFFDLGVSPTALLADCMDSWPPEGGYGGQISMALTWWGQAPLSLLPAWLTG